MDLLYVAMHMREADRVEIAAMSGHTPYKALLESFKMSDHVVTMDSPTGAPVLVFGVGQRDLLSDIGTIWMLGTNEVVNNAKVVMTYTPKVLEIMLEQYRLLENYVHVKNKVSVRWLKRLGFEMDTPFEHPVSGEKFMHFQMTR